MNRCQPQRESATLVPMMIPLLNMPATTTFIMWLAKRLKFLMVVTISPLVVTVIPYPMASLMSFQLSGQVMGHVLLSPILMTGMKPLRSTMA